MLAKTLQLIDILQVMLKMSLNWDWKLHIQNYHVPTIGPVG